MQTKLLVSLVLGLTCIALGLGLGLGLSSNSEEKGETCKETQYGKCYKNGAVTTDDDRCATVGANLLKKGTFRSHQFHDYHDY